MFWLTVWSVASSGLLAVRAEKQFYQPVDVGFQFATPINLANTLQNSVAGPLSVALVVAFAGVLFAGLLMSKWSHSSARSDDSTR